jgi:hypothetical protein
MKLEKKKRNEILARLASLFSHAVDTITAGKRSEEEIEVLLSALQKFNEEK